MGEMRAKIESTEAWKCHTYYDFRIVISYLIFLNLYTVQLLLVIKNKRLNFFHKYVAIFKWRTLWVSVVSSFFR